MDKELSFFAVSSIAILIALVSFLAARFLPLSLIMIGLLSGLYFTGLIGEMADGGIAQVAAAEAGMSYVIFTTTGPILQVAGIAVGLLLRRQAVLNSVERRA
ncbi:MAG: hypothetical protein ABI905_07925 [Betaproteobacteria bacterium]